VEILEHIGRHSQQHGFGKHRRKRQQHHSGGFGFGYRVNDLDRNRHSCSLFDHGDSGKSFHSQGCDATVYGYRKLQRWLDEEPNEFGDLEFFEHLGRDDQRHGFGESSGSGNVNYPGDFGHSEWINVANGTS